MAEIPWPEWPVENALALLRDARSRSERSANDEHNDAERRKLAEQNVLAMDYAVAVVEGIRTLRPPQPEPPEVVAHRAVSEFAASVAGALRDLADALERVDDWDFREG